MCLTSLSTDCDHIKHNGMAHLKVGGWLDAKFSNIFQINTECINTH